MRRLLVVLALSACGGGGGVEHPDAAVSQDAAPPVTADWVVGIDPAAAPAGHLGSALLGQYDLSGALLGYDHDTALVSRMAAIGLPEWRIGLGRWEIATRLLPSLHDGSGGGSDTACDLTGIPADLRAPDGATDASLIADRDWFTDTGSAATLSDTQSDARYNLAYIRSAIDTATAFGATPYIDIDHMPRALSANRTFFRGGTLQGVPDPCLATWSNHVSNVRPADASIFAAAVVGLVSRVVEGASGRAAPYWEIWNEPELGYAWDQSFEEPTGSLNAYFATAITTLVQLDAYRTASADAHAKALHFGLGSFASAQTAATVISSFDTMPLGNGKHVPIDFVSFHSYSNDPLAIVADIQRVATARAASASYRSIELALTEWGTDLAAPPDAAGIDHALLIATVIARGAALGLDRAHHSLFYEFVPGQALALVRQDGSVRPAYHAYALLHALIGGGADRLAIAAAPDGAFDQGQGAALAARGADGTVRVLLVNLGGAARTARVERAGVRATPHAVTVLDDPAAAPHDAAASELVSVPARSIVLVTL